MMVIYRFFLNLDVSRKTGIISKHGLTRSKYEILSLRSMYYVALGSNLGSDIKISLLRFLCFYSVTPYVLKYCVTCFEMIAQQIEREKTFKFVTVRVNFELVSLFSLDFQFFVG